MSGGIDSTQYLKVHLNHLKKLILSALAISMTSHIGLQKRQINITPFTLLEIIEDNISFELTNNALSSIDQPYFDPSVVPSYLLSNKISKHYKVAISGDGGDELGGYQRVIKTNNINFKSNVSKLIFQATPQYLAQEIKY